MHHNCLFFPCFITHFQYELTRLQTRTDKTYDIPIIG